MNLLDSSETREVTAPLLPLLLSYTITPGSVPRSSDPQHPVTANLTFSVTNGTGQAVRCEALALVLPVGPGSGELTAVPALIRAYPGTGTEWAIAPTPQTPGAFTLKPPRGGETLKPHASLSLEFSDVLVNEMTGLVSLTVYEASDYAAEAAAGQTKRQGSLLLTKVDTGLAITNFLASPWFVTAGQPCILSWQTTAAESCVLTWDGQNHAVAPNGTQMVNPTLTTPYTLTAIGGGGSVTSQITVSVPVQVRFDGPADSVKIGGPATLSWQIAGATTGTLSPVESGQAPLVEAVGSREVHPEVTTTYCLTASASGGGTVTAQAMVVVDGIPAIDGFTISPETPVFPASPLTLSWATQQGKKISIDQGIGEVEASGSLVVHPTAPTTYTLTCENHNGAVTRSVTVQAVPIIRYRASRSPDSYFIHAFFTAMDKDHYVFNWEGYGLAGVIRGPLAPGLAVLMFMNYLGIIQKGVLVFTNAQGQEVDYHSQGMMPAGTPPPPIDPALPQIHYFGPLFSKNLCWRFSGAERGVINPGNVEVPPSGEMALDWKVSYTLTVMGANGQVAEGIIQRQQGTAGDWLSTPLPQASDEGAFAWADAPVFPMPSSGKDLE